jgi:hypothetical protein
MNHNLGGPGTTWDNLTPMFQNDNSLFNGQFERHVKTAVEQGNQVRFIVTANYGMTRSSDYASAPPAVQQVMDAETAVPNTVRYEASYVGTRRPGSPDLPSNTLTARVEKNLDSYEVAGS